MSLVLHAAVLAVLLWRWSGGTEPETSPAPSEVAMVFQSGSRNAAASRSPEAQSAPVAKPAPATPPHPASAPPPSSQPTPPLQPPTARPSPPAPLQPTPPPVPRLQAPALPLPNPAPPRVTAEPKQAARSPAASSSGRPRPGRQSAARFPAPIMRNFFIPSGAAPTAAHPFSDTFAAGEPEARRGRESDTPFDLRGAERLGPDWGDAFMEWVEEHKHYPEQAAANGEDGDSTVQLTIDRYGRVTSVRIVRRSGSVWLDAGLTGLFRDARLPPFPPGTAEQSLPVTFTMHYVLIR